MIPLEKQVTSLELSKRLKELGEKQDTLFSWIEYPDGTFHVELTKWAKSQYGGIGWVEKELFAAPTVAELGEMLPYDTHSYKSVRVDKWCCNDNCGMLMLRKTEVEARGKLLIYLIENKLVEVE